MKLRTRLCAAVSMSMLMLALPVERAAGQSPAPLTGGLEEKLTRSVIPSVDLQDATLQEVLEFLTQRTKELSKEPRGVNFVIEDPEGHLKERKVKWLKLKNVPAREVLGQVMTMCGTTARFDPYAVLIRARTDAAVVDNRSAARKEVAAMAAKNREANLAKVVIPAINFEDVTMQEGLEYFSQRTTELSKGAMVPNFVVPDQDLLARHAKALRLRNVPVTAGLRYFLSQCGAEAGYEANVIVIAAKADTPVDARPEAQRTLDAATAKNREAAMARVVMPSINFEGTSLEEAIDYFRNRFAEIEEHPPVVNFVIEDPTGALAGKKVKYLRLKNLPLTEALGYVVRECGAQVRYDEYAIVISPK